MGKVVKGIGNAFKKVGEFAKKAVGFANGILNGPLGKIASFIPGVGPFIAGAAKVVGIANGVLNGGGLKGIIGGLVGNLGGGLLGQAGSLLSKTGLGSVIGLGSQAGSSGGILDVVKGLMGSRQGDTSPAAQGDRYNLGQCAAFKPPTEARREKLPMAAGDGLRTRARGRSPEASGSRAVTTQPEPLTRSRGRESRDPAGFFMDRIAPHQSGSHAPFRIAPERRGASSSARTRLPHSGALRVGTPHAFDPSRQALGRSALTT